MKPDLNVSAKPLPIRQGPLGTVSAGPGGPYWFQQGAFGRFQPTCETCNSVGASVTIKTVYDNIRNNDAHSYWVGALLPNNAFVQVGYLNGPTTTGGYYCCAWFYEFFPPNNSSSPPIIGPEGSAGPVGSSHTYSLNSTGGGVWSFYMDNQYLGSSPAVGNRWNLGSSNTGNNPVAALSEVADATDRLDTIGPAEFKNLQYIPMGSSTLQPVPNGNLHIGCGQSPGQPVNSCLPNPYGAAEIQNTPNDFLSGSLATPFPNQCGTVTTSGGTLWTSIGPPCTGNNFTFSFIDKDGGNIIPAWISLIDSSGTQLYYTTYQSQLIPTTSSQWTINQVSWHSINVTTDEIVNASYTTQVFLTNVFSIQLTVIGYFYSLPVKNATVIMYLPDSTNQTLKTDMNGEAIFSQLPPASYSFHISVPYGITSNQVHSISGPGSIVAKVFSLPEIITIIVPPILVAILASVTVARRERRRQAMMQAQPFQVPTPTARFCRHCGQPLSPTANFCTNCGAPVQSMIQ